jgi:ElaB/YqjD/DUF883 family membrane-anchored ribosome-binding protein
MATKTAQKKASSTASNSSVGDEREKLLEDLKVLMEDAQCFTETAADSSKEFAYDKAEQVREQMHKTLEGLKSSGQDAVEIAKDKTSDFEEIVAKNPWKALGIAAVCGLAIDRMLRK